MKRTTPSAIIGAVTLILVTTLGCFPYLSHNRSEALVRGIDVDQSLEVAEQELTEGTVLTLWVLRDQPITAAQAERISELYFRFAPAISREDNDFFNIWHLTWAISNFYRHGDPVVRAALADAYQDAEARVESLDSDMVEEHFAGDELYMGDAHAGGRAYAESHLVAPGNADYLQSFGEYLAED